MTDRLFCKVVTFSADSEGKSVPTDAEWYSGNLPARNMTTYGTLDPEPAAYSRYDQPVTQR